MKRIFALLLIFVLMTAMFGCGPEVPVGEGDILMNHETTEPVTVLEPETGETGGPDAEPTEESTSEPEPSEEPSEAPTEELTEATTEAPTEAPEPTEPPHTHSYGSATVAATCTAQGYTLYSCPCGSSYQDAYTAALGHAYVDTVVPPTTEAGGYTQHTCSRCGYSYTDSYTEQLWWDTEEKVAQICAEANAYIASIGCTVEPTAGCWDAPEYTRGYQMTETWMRQKIWDFIDYRMNVQGLTRLYVTYEPYLNGWYIIVKYAI